MLAIGYCSFYGRPRGLEECQGVPWVHLRAPMQWVYQRHLLRPIAFKGLAPH